MHRLELDTKNLLNRWTNHRQSGWPSHHHLQDLQKVLLCGRSPQRHASRQVELGRVSHAESVCATEELKFYKDNVDPADMTPLKKPTTEHDPTLKFKPADETKLVDFVPGNSSKQFSISTNLDPK